jgi:hypothetical protein
MMRYLWVAGVLLKDFAARAEGLARRLKEVSESQAREAGRPIRYLTSSAPRKEQVARDRHHRPDRRRSGVHPDRRRALPFV